MFNKLEARRERLREEEIDVDFVVEIGNKATKGTHKGKLKRLKSSILDTAKIINKKVFDLITDKSKERNLNRITKNIEDTRPEDFCKYEGKTEGCLILTKDANNPRIEGRVRIINIRTKNFDRFVYL